MKPTINWSISSWLKEKIICTFSILFAFQDEEGTQLKTKPIIPMLNPLPEEVVQVRMKHCLESLYVMMISLLWLDMNFMIT